MKRYTLIFHIIHGTGKHGPEILPSRCQDHLMGLECLIKYLYTYVTEQLVVKKLPQIDHKLGCIAENIGI